MPTPDATLCEELDIFLRGCLILEGAVRHLIVVPFSLPSRPKTLDHVGMVLERHRRPAVTDIAWLEKDD
jgi:hypothetical protein